ncbi:MAG TPA: hypothetical protein VKW06_16190 [Candidatus Angelobacter sp.]|nr:hypothetical protein [Candidatus Angelobacter sp.]
MSGLSNFKVKRHLHCILLSNAPLSAAGIQERWGGMVGNAKVEAYDFSKNGIGYILKKRDDEHCDWALSDNIYLFAPGYEPKNKNERQSLKRHRARRSRRAGGSAIV